MGTHQRYTRVVVLLALMCSPGIMSERMGNRAIAANVPPVADAGSSRYAATAPVRLDGTRSYDPDSTALLSYTWT